jgi:hypothetical protein
MADGLDFSLDVAAIDRDADRLVRRYLTAGTTAVARTTKSLERKLEAATQTGAPGKLWRAWASESFPRNGPARNPVGQVFVNGGLRTRGALTYWTQPGATRARNGGFIAVPLPAAGARGRLRDLTPAQWEARTGIELRPVYRPGRAPLLVADMAVLSGRSGVARKNTAKRITAGRGSATVPIFVLLPEQRFRNSVSIGPMIAASEAELVSEYLAVVAEMG